MSAPGAGRLNTRIIGFPWRTILWSKPAAKPPTGSARNAPPGCCARPLLSRNHAIGIFNAKARRGKGAKDIGAALALGCLTKGRVVSVGTSGQGARAEPRLLSLFLAAQFFSKKPLH